MSARTLMNFGFFFVGGVVLLAVIFAILTGISVAGIVIATFTTVVVTFVKTFWMIGVAVAIILCGTLLKVLR